MCAISSCVMRSFSRTSFAGIFQVNPLKRRIWIFAILDLMAANVILGHAGKCFVIDVRFTRLDLL